MKKERGDGVVANLIKTLKSKLSIARKTYNYKYILPKIYEKAAQQPINPKKAVFIEVRRNCISNSFELLYDSLKQRGDIELSVHLLDTQNKSGNENYRNFKALMVDIADAACIFVNDSSEMMGAFHLREGSRLVQTWHACGAFKKWGFSTAQLLFGENLKNMKKFPSHNNYSLVPISSADVSWAYSEAFNIPLDSGVIRPLGVSRTDIFFDSKRIDSARTLVESVAGLSRGKKLLLYAPTFRGTVRDAAAPALPDLVKMKEKLGEDWFVLIKQHFLVKPKNRPAVPDECADFALDVTDSIGIDELLMSADCCISDYSSLVFEYSLFEKPMLFLAPDIDDYCDWRGFYYDYREFVPGPIVTDTDGVIDYLCSLDDGFDTTAVKEFKKKFMSACDGGATERILAYALGEAAEPTPIPAGNVAVATN